jgi:hypothetical protein
MALVTACLLSNYYARGEDKTFVVPYNKYINNTGDDENGLDRKNE